VIQAWYRYGLEHLAVYSNFHGQITIAHMIVSEILHLDDDIAAQPDHITLITGLLSNNDELIHWYKFPYSAKLKNLKSMTLLVPNDMPNQK